MSSRVVEHSESESDSEVTFTMGAPEPGKSVQNIHVTESHVNTLPIDSACVSQDDHVAVESLMQLRDDANINQPRQIRNSFDRANNTDNTVGPSIVDTLHCRDTYDGTLINAQVHSNSALNNNRLPYQSNIYSEATVKSTISGLNQAITCLQQQQTGMQQQQFNIQHQQASMQQKQDNITGALTNVLSMLQQLTEKSNNASQNNCATNVQTDQAASASETFTCNQQTTVLASNRAGGDHVSDIRQRNSYELGNVSSEWLSRGSTVNGNTDVYRHDVNPTTAGTVHRDQNVAMSEHIDGQGHYSQFQHRYNPYTNSSVPPLSNENPRLVSSVERTHYSRPQVTSGSGDIKIPPFNGKEEWKVWVSRFETVADRKGWPEEIKLDNILPKLQGKAGEFVFTQLSRHTLSCYSELIKELNSRFWMVETRKTYAAKFSQRAQRNGETAEEFAAELKRLYAKAYKFRNEQTRQEDLVRKFLNGLCDSDARFEVEYNKEPENIDEAVYHVVNFVQTKHRGIQEGHTDRKFKKYARRASCDDEDSSEEYLSDESNDLHRVNRVPAKKETSHNKKTCKDAEKKDPLEVHPSTENESLKVLSEAKDMLQTLMLQMQEFSKVKSVEKPTQQEYKPQRSRNVVCYNCSQKGHISRDCPQKVNKPSFRAPMHYPRYDQGPPQRGIQNNTTDNPLN